MPRVHTQKARKDYPAEGIKKGEIYYKWSTRITAGKSYMKRVHRSKVRPRPSQLTSSEFLSSAYQLNERIEDFDDENNIADFIEELTSDAETLRDETQEKLDEMPEQLQCGSTGELLQERIDALEAFINELENIQNVDDEEPDASSYPEGEDDPDWADEHETWANNRREAMEALKEISVEV